MTISVLIEINIKFPFLFLLIDYVSIYIMQEVKVGFQSAMGMKWTQSGDITDK